MVCSKKRKQKAAFPLGRLGLCLPCALRFNDAALWAGAEDRTRAPSRIEPRGGGRLMQNSPTVFLTDGCVLARLYWEIGFTERRINKTYAQEEEEKCILLEHESTN